MMLGDISQFKTLNLKDIIYSSLSFFFALRLIYELKEKWLNPKFLNIEKIKNFDDLDTSFELLYKKKEIIKTSREKFEHALSLNQTSGNEVKIKQTLRIWMNGFRKKTFNSLQLNFNLILWIKHSLTLVLIAGLQTSPEFQILCLLTQEIFFSLFFLTKVKQYMKYKLVKFYWSSFFLSSLLFFLQSLYFTPKSNKFNFSNPLINLVELISITFFLLSFFSSVLHYISKLIYIAKIYKTEKKISDEILSDGNSIDNNVVDLSDLEKSFEFGMTRSMRYSMQYNLQELNVPQYSIRTRNVGSGGKRSHKTHPFMY